MSFTKNFLANVIKYKQIKYKDGKIIGWGTPCTMFPTFSLLYLYEYLKKELNEKKVAEIFYSLGKFQGETAFKLIMKRFGFKKKIPNKKQFISFYASQAPAAGQGTWKMIVINFKKNIFIAVSKSPFAEEYKKYFGIQTNPVDHFMRGQCTALFEMMLKQKMFAVEKKCLAKGNIRCEIVTKPLEDWDKKDKLFNSQFVKETPSIQELDAKISPYIHFLNHR